MRIRGGAWWVIIAWITLVWAPLEAVGQARAERPTLNAEAMQTLRDGGHIVRTARGTPNSAEITAVVPIPIEMVYRIIREYDAYPSWYPDQVSARLLEESEFNAVAEGEVRLPFPFANRTYVVDVTGREASYQGRTVVHIQWLYREGSGNMDQMYGYWYLERWEDDPENATLLRYALWADLGVWLPDAIVRWATRRMLPGIIEGMQTRYRTIRGG